MPNFTDHISQVKSNLTFLRNVNNKIDNSIDWQVTVCFYTAVHLVNAHLSKFNLHYRRHVDVNHALNSENQTSIAKLPEAEYLSYRKLQSLSRRSRYLVNGDKNKNSDNLAHITYGVHFAKAIRHLDKLLTYFKGKYEISIEVIEIKSQDVNNKELSSIKVK